MLTGMPGKPRPLGGIPALVWRMSALAAAAVLVIGCAGVKTGRSTGAPGRTPSTAGRETVTLSRDGQAWALASHAVLVRAANSWAQVNPPVTPAGGNSVVVRGQLELVASVTGPQLTLAISHNGGATWTEATASLSTPTSDVYVAVSPDATHWIVGPAGSASMGSASQYSYAFVNTSSGGLAQVSLPGAAENMSWSGSDLVVPGGPADSHLYLSADLGQTWQDVSAAVLGFAPPTANIGPTEPLFGPVLGLPDGTAIVPVEHVNAQGLTVDLEAITSASTYRMIGSVAAQGDYGVGPYDLPSSTYGSQQVAVVLPGSSNLYVVGSEGAPAVISMSGLPVAPDSVSFQDSVHGVAQTTVRACASGKTDCSVTVSEYATSDGGSTWTLAALKPAGSA
jgi:hypothetical protein